MSSTGSTPTAPILLPAFNRADLLAQAISTLDAVRPSQVILALDGPRADYPDESAHVQTFEDLVRAAVDELADCEQTVLRRTKSSG